MPARIKVDRQFAGAEGKEDGGSGNSFVTASEVRGGREAHKPNIAYSTLRDARGGRLPVVESRKLP
jgi:hypothetical protein